VSTVLAARARELALLFTSHHTVTGTSGEIDFSGVLFQNVSYFDKVWFDPPENDVRETQNVFALKRGKSKRTIVLTGHYDTVSFDDYDRLSRWALSPEELLPRLIDVLRKSGKYPLALADFESGEFLPGRGLLDMKAGLAAGIAAMEAYHGDATLLFVGVFDEEAKSGGARLAGPALKKIEDEYELEIALVINLDAISDQGDGSKGRVVTFGSIGKQLLTAYIVGKHTHAGYPQDGLNAAYVMAELVRRFELAPELAEITGGEVAAPPTVLYAKDSKQEYNVTTPDRACAYWNTMQHQRSGAEVLDIAMQLAAEAIAAAEIKTGQKIALMRYAELAAMNPISISADIRSDLPLASMVVTTGRIEQVGITEPTVILGFGAIPYPAVLLRDQNLRNKITEAVRDFDIGTLNYFAGISDMSFFGEAAGDLSVVASNTPIWGTHFIMPEPAGYPCINLGPWGRDYHHWLERLHAPYAFEVLPRALLAVIDAVV
jgi:arginine utilization protein RocB